MHRRKVVYLQERIEKAAQGNNYAKSKRDQISHGDKAEKRAKKFCRFIRNMVSSTSTTEIAEFLKKFLNEQGKMLPRRITGNSLKYQRKVSDAKKKPVRWHYCHT